MKNFLGCQLSALRDFFNGINNTTWGVVILFYAIHLVVQGTHVDAAYYFAGIGSTLLGVSHPGASQRVVNTGDNPTTNTNTGA